MTWLETQQLRVGLLTCLNHHQESDGRVIQRKRVTLVGTFPDELDKILLIQLLFISMLMLIFVLRLIRHPLLINSQMEVNVS